PAPRISPSRGECPVRRTVVSGLPDVAGLAAKREMSGTRTEGGGQERCARRDEGATELAEPEQQLAGPPWHPCGSAAGEGRRDPREEGGGEREGRGGASAGEDQRGGGGGAAGEQGGDRGDRGGGGDPARREARAVREAGQAGDQRGEGEGGERPEERREPHQPA